MIRVGIDAGGTFTDCVALLETGELRTCKLRSRPDDPAAVVREALDLLVPAGESAELSFSTTAATNALLERTGGPTILLTTAGFEDVLEIARQTRPELYALHPVLVQPLVGVEHRLGVAERIDVRGEIVLALSDAEIARVVAAVGQTIATIAICFLHAYRNDTHERRLASRLRALGHTVSVSSEVCPLPREYERTSTTVVDAYVAPRLGETLARLASPRVVLRVMESTGGVRLVDKQSALRPARTVLSGPAAGLVGVERVMTAHGLRTALALDVGGTSTDVAYVDARGAARSESVSIGAVTIALPSLAVDSIGAGGGSIAWLDGGGALRVGPRSAGAVPGPAAYGRGGVEATLTDAHVVLGRLSGTLAGGSVALDREKARAALRPIANALGIDVVASATAIVAVADAAIARALRTVALGREVDALIAYGGAAGLHVVDVARELGISRVLVPASPGLACALGALGAPTVVEELVAWSEVLADLPSAALLGKAAALRARVEVALVGERRGAKPARLELLAQLRYEGQGPEAIVEIPVEGLSRARFAVAYEALNGHRLDRAVVVTRVLARGTVDTLLVPTMAASAIGWPRIGTRTLVLGREEVRAPLYRRDRVREGRLLLGPAVITELSATLYLPPGAVARCLSDGALELNARLPVEHE